MPEPLANQGTICLPYLCVQKMQGDVEIRRPTRPGEPLHCRIRLAGAMSDIVFLSVLLAAAGCGLATVFFAGTAPGMTWTVLTLEAIFVPLCIVGIIGAWRRLGQPAEVYVDPDRLIWSMPGLCREIPAHQVTQVWIARIGIPIGLAAKWRLIVKTTNRGCYFAEFFTRRPTRLADVEAAIREMLRLPDDVGAPSATFRLMKSLSQL